MDQQGERKGEGGGDTEGRGGYWGMGRCELIRVVEGSRSGRWRTGKSIHLHPHLHPVTDHFHFCSDIMSGHKKLMFITKHALHTAWLAATGTSVDQG